MFRNLCPISMVSSNGLSSSWRTPLLVRDNQVSDCSSRIIRHGARKDASERRGRLSRRYSDDCGVGRKTDPSIGQTACLALVYPVCREPQISAVPLKVVRKKLVPEAALVKIDREHLSINIDKVHADCRPTVTTFTGTLSTTAWTSGNASSRTTTEAPFAGSASPIPRPTARCETCRPCRSC